jgi:predicted acyl esterase
MRKLAVVAAVACAAIGSTSVARADTASARAAQADVPAASGGPASVFNGQVACTTLSSGIRFCGSQTVDGQTVPVRTTATSFDGTAVDVNFALPPASATHHGPYPLVMLFHGYGGSKFGLGSSGGGIGSALNSMTPWLKAGYATFSMSDRGFGESCGTPDSRAALPAAECAHGFNHLMDTRYEVRDAQWFAGELADEGLVSPTRIAAIGGSYGGGLSMALAALRNRVMLPSGKLVPWRSPHGKRMQIAAATPFVPWTNLPYSLVPNGSTLDYVANAPYRGRIGVMKQSLISALYTSGCGANNLCSSNPNWNITAWYKRLMKGEPYTGSFVHRMFSQLSRFHSSYGIDHSQAPAPLLIANGWTDDLFPVDEALRYYNRTKTQYPNTPLSLYFGDWGHPRAQNKTADLRRYVTAVHRWLNYYVRHQGPKPFQGVSALTETCPSTARSAGPYRAADWAQLAPGEVRFSSPIAQTIRPKAGSLSVGTVFDPLNLQGGACATAPAATQSGTATYRRRVGHAFTLMGAPTVVADFRLPGANSQVSARLLDVFHGRETLVARGIWRPQVSKRPVRQVFQLHPAAWRFAAGHTIKLELLPDDAPYDRPSNGQRPVTVSKLQLRLPTLQRPGAAGGTVKTPLPSVVPRGEKLAAEYASLPWEK